MSSPHEFDSPQISLVDTQDITFPQDPLAQFNEVYKGGQLTPELLTSFNQALWKRVGEVTGVKVEVPPANFAQVEIEAFEKSGDMLMYVPPEYAGKENRELVLQAFSVVDNHEIMRFSRKKTEFTTVTDVEEHSGYMLTESYIDTPYKRTNVNSLKAKLKKVDRKGMNLTDYLVAALYSKILTGHYIDEEPQNSSRLLMSRTNRGFSIPAACFSLYGNLTVYWGVDSNTLGDYIGGRSVELL